MCNNRKVVVGHAFQSEVVLYCDGGCVPNPGIGGWGYVLRHLESGYELSGSGAEERTTNNRMEMVALIEGLKQLTRPVVLEVVSDSMLLLEGCATWRHNWKKRGWMRSRTEPVKNLDLWRVLDALLEPHSIRYVWVRGHSGDEYNEVCNALAMKAIEQQTAAMRRSGRPDISTYDRIR